MQKNKIEKMADLSCKYLGISLKNPIIIGSSALTSNIENLKQFENNGAGAVILKSIFEEQIKLESHNLINSNDKEISSWKDAFNDIVSSKEYYYDDAYNYLTNYAKEHTLNQYLKFIDEAKRNIKIPIIASIHCNTQYNWQYFSKKLEEAGADALELNVYLLPSDFNKDGKELEQVYFDIIKEVKKYVKIPVSLKIGYYFSSFANFTLKLSESGINGLTLFNRPYNPDIDIDKIEISSSNKFSNSTEYTHSLRWVALLSGKLKCDIAASTGIHNYETIIKQILAGADAIQIVSVLYQNNASIISEMLKQIEEWMKKHNFSNISDFKGKLSYLNVNNPAAYERVQFIKLYSSTI